MRRRGASGGGTLRNGELQLLHCSPPESAARSQCPRAAHSGLIHCTVQPGRYCTLSPLTERTANFLPSGPSTGYLLEKLPEFCAVALVVSSAKIQFLVVGLQTVQ